MRMKRLGYTALLSFAFLGQMSFAAEQEKMVFKNHYGSILEITAGKDGSIQGYFTTKVATKDCQQVIGQKSPVVGFLTGNALTLSIHYPSCGSAVSIIGNFKDKKNLDTTWIAAHQIDPSKNSLSSQFMGHNKFTRIS